MLTQTILLVIAVEAINLVVGVCCEWNTIKHLWTVMALEALWMERHVHCPQDLLAHESDSEENTVKQYTHIAHQPQSNT